MKSEPIENKLCRNFFISKSGCWQWKGGKTPKGYGRIHSSVNGKTVSHYAHRVSYEYFIEKIPDGLVIDHLCRKRDCVNPGHMEVVTVGVNVMRGNAPAAVQVRGYKI